MEMQKRFISFDQDTFLDHFSGETDIINEISQEFISSCANMISSIKDAINNQDPAALALSSHSFKGAVSNFYANEIRELAFKMEKIGKEGRIDNAAEILTEMEAKAGIFLKELQEFINEL